MQDMICLISEYARAPFKLIFAPWAAEFEIASFVASHDKNWISVSTRYSQPNQYISNKKVNSLT